MIKFNEMDKKYEEKGIHPTYFITCFEKNGTEINKYKMPDFGDQRTFGFYYDLETARKALNENWCDMHECLYMYAVIEKMYPGIHPDCYLDTDIEWYQYDKEKDGFFLIDTPKHSVNLCNYALG